MVNYTEIVQTIQKMEDQQLGDQVFAAEAITKKRYLKTNNAYT